MQATLDVDEHHWWYRGRRAVIGAELERLPVPCAREVLDAGCGSGRTLLELGATARGRGSSWTRTRRDASRARAVRGPRGRLEELPWPTTRST